MRRRLCAFAAASATAISGVAQAQVEDATNPAIAELLIGPSIFLTGCGSGGCNSGSLTQFKLQQVLGYHVNGEGDGFAIGLGLSEAFGEGFFRFQPGLRLFGDVRVTDDYSVFITPYGHLGYGLATVAVSGIGGTAHAFNWTAGVGIKVVLLDQFTLSFSPVGLDFLANDDGLAMFFDLNFGFGVTF